MKQLGLSWVDGIVNELKKFDFVFHVDLKEIKKKAKLEEIIVDQHKGLNCNGVHRAEVKEILQRKRVLLLFDGYDEYHDYKFRYRQSHTKVLSEKLLDNHNIQRNNTTE